MKLIFNFALAKPLEQFERGVWVVQVNKQPSSFPWPSWAYAVLIERPEINFINRNLKTVGVFCLSQPTPGKKLKLEMREEPAQVIYTRRTRSNKKSYWRSIDESVAESGSDGGGA